MSEQEQRQIKAMALLEAEEAQKALSLLFAKASNWRMHIQYADNLLGRMAQSGKQGTYEIEAARANIQSNLEPMRHAMDLDALLAFDQEVKSAVLRLAEATRIKHDLGF